MILATAIEIMVAATAKSDGRSRGVTVEHYLEVYRISVKSVEWRVSMTILNNKCIVIRQRKLEAIAAHC